jgi:hypothetical protein
VSPAKRLLELLAVVGWIAFGARGALAGEILCIQQWGDRGVPPISTEVASKAWPSGFRPSATSCKVALLRGLIARGDYEQYKAFYSHYHRALEVLLLVSEGGNAEEALKIGRLLRKYLLSVFAPSRSSDTSFRLMRPSDISDLCRGPSCICVGACALIWFGGVSRAGHVGLHRPGINDPEFNAPLSADASTVYKRTLQEITRYLEEMEAPRPLIDTTFATSSSEIQWVEEVDGGSLEYPPSFIEWVDANCGSLTSHERKTQRELFTRSALQEPLTATEVMLEKMLTEKLSNHINCRLTLVRARRDALAAP